MDRLFLLNRYPRLRAQLFFTVTVLLAITALFLYMIHISAKTSPRFTISPQNATNAYGRLGFAHEIYVINLPHRDDRQKDMERLRDALGLQWIYTDGVYINSSLVRTTSQWVQTIRTGAPRILGDEGEPSSGSITFTWPENIDDLARSTTTLEFWSNGNGIWPLPSSIPPGQPLSLPMAAATKNFDISTNFSSLPGHLLLTEARIACWLGHLNVIHRIANSLLPGDDGFSIILEDDVDMERDIDQQMKRLWPYLPQDWDIVFLGHCWSDEGRGEQLSPHDDTSNLNLNGTSNSSLPPESSNSQLHASQKPKCTHAYALSRIGARRLLLHLRYPPFAFSRAIDQAFAWLVESNRVKSYSIVPSLVVQRKVMQSDIMEGGGVKWKDTLVKGVFADSETTD